MHTYEFTFREMLKHAASSCYIEGKSKYINSDMKNNY